MHPIFLKGKKIFLSPLAKEDDFSTYAQWINDQDTTLFMGSGRFPLSIDALREYVDEYNHSKDGMLLGIFSNASSKHVGNITLHQIDWRNQNAEMGIIIGDRNSRGKGYATEAIMLVVEHAFNKLGLHKLYAGMIKGNEASQCAFEKVGFKVEGTLKQHFYLNGGYHDCYRIGFLRSEFEKKNKR